MNKEQLRKTIRKVLRESLSPEDLADQEAQFDAERNVRRLDTPDDVTDLLADMIDGLPKADLDGLYGALQRMSEAELGAALASAIFMVTG